MKCIEPQLMDNKLISGLSNTRIYNNLKDGMPRQINPFNKSSKKKQGQIQSNRYRNEGLIDVEKQGNG